MDYQDNLLVPTELGEYYYKKPPLYNWLLIGSYRIFGEASEFAVRFFGALSHWLIGILILLFARKEIGFEKAFLAACFWWVSVDLFFYFSMFGEIDLVYSLITFSAMMLLFRFGERKEFLSMFLLAYGLHALGFLTKGLPSIVFAGITTFAYLLSSRQWKLLWSWQHFAGMAFFLAITGSYFYAYSMHNSPYGFVEDLWSQSADRTATQYGIGTFLLHLLKFPAISIKDILPGSLFLPILFLKPVRQAIWKNNFLRFCLLAFGLNIIIYWISPGTRSRYVYMLYPFLLILISWTMWQYFERWKSFVKPIAIAFAVILALAGGTLTYISFTNASFIPKGAIVINLIMAGCIFLLAFSIVKWRQQFLWLLLAAMLVSRLWFDLTILRIRANEGLHAEVKENAMKIAEITKGETLHLYQFKNEGWFSLAMAFYLTREQHQVLDLEYEANCEDYFIGFDHEFAGKEVTVHYEFDWRDFHYYLVTFEHCP